jgi:hypothetical protein
MEVEASRVGDGGCSKEGFRSNSTQMQMEEVFKKIGVRPSKVGGEEEGG